MQIDMMQIARLAPYIRNARTHSADQVAQIAASMAEFGFTNPILIGEDDVIIAGHGRLLAAQSLGLAQVPVIVPARAAAQCPAMARARITSPAPPRRSTMARCSAVVASPVRSPKLPPPAARRQKKEAAHG